VLERRKDIVTKLQDFEKDGDLVICKEPTQDLIEVADVCVEVRDAGLLPEKGGIGVDRMGLPGILEELMSRGFDVDINGGTITGIPQGGHLNAAIIGSERKLKDGTLWHAGQPMMSWCVGNAKVEMKTNARSITKETAGSAKIDPLSASFDALMLMSRNPEAVGISVYEERGIRMV
jgi:phage terminase large subunit-like protein